MCMGKKERDIQQATLFQAIQRQFPSCKKRGGSEPRLRREPARPLVSSACLACFPGGGNRVLPSPRTVEARGQPSVPQQHASPSLVLNDYNQGNVKSHKKTALRFKTKICVFIPTLLFFKTRKKKNHQLLEFKQEMMIPFILLQMSCSSSPAISPSHSALTRMWTGIKDQITNLKVTQSQQWGGTSASRIRNKLCCLPYVPDSMLMPFSIKEEIPTLVTTRKVSLC